MAASLRSTLCGCMGGSRCFSLSSTYIRRSRTSVGSLAYLPFESRIDLKGFGKILPEKVLRGVSLPERGFLFSVSKGRHRALFVELRLESLACFLSHLFLQRW